MDPHLNRHCVEDVLLRICITNHESPATPTFSTRLRALLLGPRGPREEVVQSMAQRKQIGQWLGEWKRVAISGELGVANKNSKFCFLNHGPDVLRRGQEGINRLPHNSQHVAHQRFFSFIKGLGIN